MEAIRRTYTVEGESALRQALLSSFVQQTLRGHTERVNGVAYSPDGKQLVSVSNDQTMRIWDVATGRQVSVLSAVAPWLMRANFSPDGKQIAIASAVNSSARVWDVTTSSYLLTLAGHS